jgi:hypothetical protein
MTHLGQKGFGLSDVSAERVAQVLMTNSTVTCVDMVSCIVIGQSRACCKRDACPWHRHATESAIQAADFCWRP